MLACRLGSVLDRIFALDVPREWQHPNFSDEAAPTLRLHFARDEMRAGFLVTVTTFAAPQQVTLEELRIESCFPLDDTTRVLCERLARG